MTFYSVRDLRSSSRNIWNSLTSDGEIIITNNGKPAALMLDISRGNFEETLMAIKQAQAMIAVNNIRSRWAQADPLSLDEINAEIKAAREEMKGCSL